MLGKSGNKKFSHRYSTNVTEPLPEPWNLWSLHEWKNHTLEKRNKVHGRTAHDLPELKNEAIRGHRPSEIIKEMRTSD